MQIGGFVGASRPMGVSFEVRFTNLTISYRLGIGLFNRIGKEKINELIAV